MRSYDQFCALAKALDIVGDRWTLLIVRELLVRPCRYTDLYKGLPGIATNLLARRLEELEAAGLVSREAAPPPIATTLFHLTPRGRELEPVIAALGRWGAPVLAEATGKEVFRSHWYALPVSLYVQDNAPADRPVSIEVAAPDGTVTIETVGDGSVHVRMGRAAKPDLRMEGPPNVVLSVLSGKLKPSAARAKGLRHSGDVRVLRRFAAK